MLVLTRKRSQTIEVAGGFENGGVTVTLVQSRNGSARIGIKADKDIEIIRGEVEAFPQCRCGSHKPIDPSVARVYGPELAEAGFYSPQCQENYEGRADVSNG